MEVQKENVMSAYNVADENGKQLLKALFPSVEFEQAKDDRPSRSASRHWKMLVNNWEKSIRLCSNIC